MRKQKKKEDRSRQLRGAAEEKLARTPGTPSEIREKSLEEIIHELQVYQIELEMQNEELRRSQLALEESRSKYMDLYDFSPVGYFTFTHKALIAEVNLTGAALLGAQRQKLINSRFRRFVVPGDQDLWDQHIMSVLKKRERKSCDLVLKRVDGSTFPARLDSLLMEVEGETPLIRTVISDITERRRAEEALRQQSEELAQAKLQIVEDNFRRSMDESPLGLRIVAGTGETLYANRAILDIYGYDSVAELDTTPTKERYSPESYAEFQIRKKKRQRGDNVPTQYEISIVRKDGEIRHLEVFRRKVLWDGEWHFQAIYHDVTERKRTEQILRKQREDLFRVSRLATLGEFAASIAHEIHQPLAAIMNNAMAAQRFLSPDTPDIDEARDAVEDIINNDQHASEVIRHLRLFLKRTETEKTILNINTVIEEVLKILHPDILDRQIHITLDENPDIPWIKGNRVELQQVFINLILNACDSMVQAGIQRREIFIRTSMDEPGSIIVAVQDSGAGLDTNEMNRVFEPYYTTKPEGLGMGLSICKTITEAHGGRIWVVNNPEGGATFSVALPIENGNA